MVWKAITTVLTKINIFLTQIYFEKISLLWYETIKKASLKQIKEVYNKPIKYLKDNLYLLPTKKFNNLKYGNKEIKLA